MAAWQVELHLLPRSALAGAAQQLSPAALKETDWWASTTLPPGYARDLAAITAAEASPHASVQTWGARDGNRVEVWSANERVTRVRVYVDVRRLDSRFGAALILFLREADAVLVRADGHVVESTIDAYAKSLRTSAAWRHASDPLAFIAAREAEERDDA